MPKIVKYYGLQVGYKDSAGFAGLGTNIQNVFLPPACAPGRAYTRAGALAWETEKINVSSNLSYKEDEHTVL